MDVDSLDCNVSRRESTSITIGYGCCGSTWLLGELKAADEQAVFARPRQDKAWRGAERSIGRVFQNQVLFYYGRANKFFQSWPLRYRPPFEIKRSHPVELCWFDSVFFEYLSTVRGKSCRENFSFLFSFLFLFFLETRRPVFASRYPFVRSESWDADRDRSCVKVGKVGVQRVTKWQNNRAVERSRERCERKSGNIEARQLCAT